MKIIKFVLLTILILSCTCLGCTSFKANPSQAPSSAATGAWCELKDDNGINVVIPKKPQRIVVLSPSFLELLAKVDGKVVGKASSNLVEVPAMYKEIKNVGPIFDINTEEVVGLNPDLIIAYKGMHERYIHLFEGNNIPVLVLKLQTYEDVIHSQLVLGKVCGEPANATAAVQELKTKISTTLSKMPKTKKRIGILHVTPQGVTLEKETTIAGCCAKELGCINIVSEKKQTANQEAMPPKKTGKGNVYGMAVPNMVPFSLEYLVSEQPDIIFITYMGGMPEIKMCLAREVESNPAWSSLQAVQDKHVYFLPDKLFLTNPGLEYPEAIEFMAKKIYPDMNK